MGCRSRPAPAAPSVVQAPQAAAQTPAAGPRCRVEGHVRSGNLPLPGASVIVQVGDAVKAATSTDTDGKFTITFSPNATYHIAAELTAFTRADRDLTLAAPPCDTTLDFVLSLRPRREATAQPQAPAARVGRGEAAAEPTQPAQAPGATSAASGATPENPAADQRARGGRGRGGAGAAAGGRGGQRFQTLTAQTDANGAPRRSKPRRPKTAAMSRGCCRPAFPRRTRRPTRLRSTAAAMRRVSIAAC